MTPEEFLNYAKEKELAKTWDEHSERVAQMKAANR